MTRKNKISRQRFGLRRELLVTQIILLVSAWLLGGAIFLGIAEQAFIESRLKQGVTVTRFAAAQLSSVNSLLSDHKSWLYQALEEADVEAWKVYDHQLNLLNSLEVNPRTTVITQTISRLLQQGELKLENKWPGWWQVIFQQTTPTFTVAAPICSGNNCKGVVQVKFHFGDVVKRLKQILIWVCGYTLIYVVVLGIFALFVLNRNIVQPMQSLLKAIKLIGSGKLDTKLIESGPLEIYTLTQSFNSMTQALKTSRTETEQSIESLQKIDKQLKQTQSELVQSEKLASVGTLAAGMAHEVGNPLAAIIGYLEILKEQLTEEPDKTIAQRAAEEALRIDHLVKDLLDYANPSQGSLVTCNPWEAVHNAVALLNNQGALTGVEVNIAARKELPAVRINPRRLVQVLVNLLLNARDACLSDTKTISINGGENSDSVWLTVKDTGHGISQQTQQRIFDPFFTTKQPGQGRGLGLSVCQRVMEEANGQILISQEEATGSTFRLIFPRTEDSEI